MATLGGISPKSACEAWIQLVAKFDGFEDGAAHIRHSARHEPLHSALANIRDGNTKQSVSLTQHLRGGHFFSEDGAVARMSMLASTSRVGSDDTGVFDAIEHLSNVIPRRGEKTDFLGIILVLNLPVMLALASMQNAAYSLADAVDHYHQIYRAIADRDYHPAEEHASGQHVHAMTPSESSIYRLGTIKEGVRIQLWIAGSALQPIDMFQLHHTEFVVDQMHIALARAIAEAPHWYHRRGATLDGMLDVGDVLFFVSPPRIQTPHSPPQKLWLECDEIVHACQVYHAEGKVQVVDLRPGGALARRSLIAAVVELGKRFWEDPHVKSRGKDAGHLNIFRMRLFPRTTNESVDLSLWNAMMRKADGAEEPLTPLTHAGIRQRNQLSNLNAGPVHLNTPKPISRVPVTRPGGH